MAKKLQKGSQVPTSENAQDGESLDARFFDLAKNAYSLGSSKVLLPWERHILRLMCLVDGEGRWANEVYGFQVPRRNGKTEVLFARELLALLLGHKVAHTAHLLTTALAAQSRLLQIIEDGLGLDIKKSISKSGAYITLLSTGGRIDYRTRTNKGGVGEGYDLLVIDEAQEFTNIQSAALLYTVSDSAMPQTIYLGTPPTPTSVGTVFRNYRSDVLAGRLKHSGYSEWSVGTEEVDCEDVEVWYRVNPSLGYFLSERSLWVELDGAKTKGTMLDFQIQRLGRWYTESLHSQVPAAQWDSLALKEKPAIDSPLYAAVKFDVVSGRIAIAVASKVAGGQVFVDGVADVPLANGAEWAASVVMKMKNLAMVIVDGTVGAQTFLACLDDIKPKFSTLRREAGVRDIVAACSAFELAIDAKTVCHLGQVGLRLSVTSYEHRAIGKSGFGFRPIVDGVDSSLAEATALAFFICSTAKPKRKVVQKVGY